MVRNAVPILTPAGVTPTFGLFIGATMDPPSLDAAAKALATAKAYADVILKPPLAELGGILSDAIGQFRLRNRVRLILKTKTFLEERGVEPTQLLPDIFVPLVEEASNTSDETLSDMFARLLAAHLDEERAPKVHPAFAKTLGQLSPLDVQVLTAIDRKDENNWDHREQPDRQATWSRLSLIQAGRKRWSATAGQIQLSLSNLERLGLIRETKLDRPPDEYDGEGRPIDVHDLKGTDFAQRLLCAVIKPGEYWRHNSDQRSEELWQRMEAARKHRSREAE
jgi:hypothetical protein